MYSRALLALLLGLGCSKKPAEGPPVVEDPPVEAPDTTAGGSPVLVLHKALSVKDPEPDCADIEALVDDPLPALVELAEANAMPPWAGMRAATCVITRHPDAAADRLVAWSTSEMLKGLGLLVLDHLDQLPETLAVRVAGEALEGPLAEMAQPRVAASTRATVRALLPEATP